MTFKQHVEQELAGLDIDQQQAFARRCAVRALPLLGSKGNFNFWKKKDTQKYLYNVLSALDLAAAGTAAAAYTDTYGDA